MAFGGLASEDRGVILLYPVRAEQHQGPPILAFECIVPEHPVRMGWVVVDSAQDAPIVCMAVPETKRNATGGEKKKKRVAKAVPTKKQTKNTLSTHE